MVGLLETQNADPPPPGRSGLAGPGARWCLLPLARSWHRQSRWNSPIWLRYPGSGYRPALRSVGRNRHLKLNTWRQWSVLRFSPRPSRWRCSTATELCSRSPDRPAFPR